MSRCSKKINEIKEKLDSISGLNDDYVYRYLESIDSIVTPIVEICTEWSEISNEHRNYISKKKNKKSFKRNHEEVEKYFFFFTGLVYKLEIM